MKKINIIVCTLFIMFFSCLNAKSLSYGGCEYSQISKLRSYVSNVNISYDYKIIDNTAYFDITLNNLVPGMYFVDSVTNIKYNYNDSVDGELVIRNHNSVDGSFKFYSSLDACYGIKLNTKYYSLPDYNIYYYSTLCESNRNFSLCKKWIKMNYSYNEFEKMLYEYNNPAVGEQQEEEVTVEYKTTFLDKFVNFYVKYYHIMLIGIIVTCVIIMVITNKKNKFDV